jgi:hypothetical protein
MQMHMLLASLYPLETEISNTFQAIRNPSNINQIHLVFIWLPFGYQGPTGKEGKTIISIDLVILIYVS